jgi:hypothetical protein
MINMSSKYLNDLKSRLRKLSKSELDALIVSTQLEMEDYAWESDIQTEMSSQPNKARVSQLSSNMHSLADELELMWAEAERRDLDQGSEADPE